jgi:carotenoid cleavage dioxygenase-like enzyme
MEGCLLLKDDFWEMVLADVIRVLENGDLETIGRKYLNPLANRFTAHPKIDPFTGLIANPHFL